MIRHVGVVKSAQCQRNAWPQIAVRIEDDPVCIRKQLCSHAEPASLHLPFESKLKRQTSQRQILPARFNGITSREKRYLSQVQPWGRTGRTELVAALPVTRLCSPPPQHQQQLGEHKASWGSLRWRRTKGKSRHSYRVCYFWSSSNFGKNYLHYFLCNQQVFFPF